jgi:hypothetical protein
MNLLPPPGPPPKTDDTVAMQQWLETHYDWILLLYEFLKFPAFGVIKLVPRATAPGTEEGSVYYDSDDDKLKCRDASSWQDTY